MSRSLPRRTSPRPPVAPARAGVLRVLRLARWEWSVLGATLLILTLFMMGHDLFGLSAPLSASLALLASLVTAITLFIWTALLFPLLALLAGVVAILITVLMWLGALLVGGIFLPVAAFFTGLVGGIFTWLAGTWLGSLLLPLYNVLAPLVFKIAPWLTASKYAGRAWNIAQRLETTKALQAQLNRLIGQPPRRQKGAASQNARRGRSSGRAQPRHAPPRRKAK